MQITEEEFLNMGARLGIKINRAFSNSSEFVDVESFFLYSTLFIRSSIRVARYIEYWTLACGHYLSVKKLNDLIKDGHPFDPIFLNGLLRIIDENYDKSGPLKVLKKYAKKSHSRISIVEGFEFHKVDQRWLKANVCAPVFIPDEFDKVIREPKWIKENCPEIYYRIIGISPILADIRSFVEFNPDVSLYKVAKTLKLTYSCVHSNYKKFIKPFSKNSLNIFHS